MSFHQVPGQLNRFAILSPNSHTAAAVPGVGFRANSF
jgi:hypothetical protein